MAHSDYMIQLMKEAYERGDAKAAMARNFSCSPTTVTRYADKFGWLRPEEGTPKDVPVPAAEVGDDAGAAAESMMMSDDLDLPSQSVPSASELPDPAEDLAGVSGAVDPADLPDLAPVPGDAQSAEIAELKALNAKLLAERAELEAKVDALKDTHDIEIYTNPEEVRRVVGDDALRENALNRLYFSHRQNMQRFGHMPVDYHNEANKGLVETEINLLITELLKERTSHISPLKNLRVIKMVNPKTGHIVQIAMEDQVNNMKGEQSAPIAKARAKGLQLAEPYLCQLLDCWLVALRDPVSQEMAFNGYCGPEHRARDPYLSGTQVSNVTTTAHIGQRGY